MTSSHKSPAYKITNLHSGKSGIIKKSQIKEFSIYNSIFDKPIVKIEEVLLN